MKEKKKKIYQKSKVISMEDLAASLGSCSDGNSIYCGDECSAGNNPSWPGTGGACSAGNNANS